MKIDSLIAAFTRAGKRTHLIGTPEYGVLAALDMEGRLFAVLNGEVLNRVNLDAVQNPSISGTYHNPAGDGLWPAPEGTALGFQYPTGNWRVAAGIRFARYFVRDEQAFSCTIFSEIDLINNRGLGMPMLFERSITVNGADGTLELLTTERFTYLGTKKLSGVDAIIAPWSLSQFECAQGCKVVFPYHSNEAVWDLYEDKILPEIAVVENSFQVPVNGNKRFQIGISKDIPWIEFQDPTRKLRVRREALDIPSDHRYIDIRDASPDTQPNGKGVKYSVYADPSGFMEIEAAGGIPYVLEQGQELLLTMKTSFSKQ